MTSDRDVGAVPAGSPLPFAVTPTHAEFEVPLGSDLERTSHYLSASVRDLAGNEAIAVYGFAVRDFAEGAPLGDLQTIFLDFSTDRSLTSEIDFIEDLRTYGLSSASDPTTEAIVLGLVVQEVVERVHPFYGRNPDGSAGADAANIQFDSQLPAVPHARLCVGGESSSGPLYLGGSSLDPNNRMETEDECQGVGAVFGVFPQAIDDLWGYSPGYHQAFDPLLPGLGTPVGAHPLDTIVLDPEFDPYSATQAESARLSEIVLAYTAFAQIVATAVAHETGHLLGLTTSGATPGGLFGQGDHNSSPQGGTPLGNLVMNPGGAFSFEEASGFGGEPVPVFRPLNWAYLRDRIVLDSAVTGLFPAPEIGSVSPNPLSATAILTVTGENFLATPYIHLLIESDPTPNLLTGITLIDSQTLTGVVKASQNPPGTYDVRITNPDGQSVTLIDALVVQ